MLHAPGIPRTDQGALGLDERIAGAVERVTFHSETSGFCVLQVRARGYKCLVTVVGHAASVAVGEFIEAEGAWRHHRHHGVQFAAEELRVSTPTTVDDLRRFLASGLIRGIGPAFAQRLVAAFGARVLDVIERRPEAVAGVPGIGLGRARAIAEAWAQHRSMRTLAAFLHDHGIGGSLLMRVYRAYGREAEEVIRTNPYRLALDLGVDFAGADRIAARLGHDRESSVRLHAALAGVLAGAVDEGHCGLPVGEAVERASLVAGLPPGAMAAAVDAQCAAGEFVSDDVEGRRCLFPRSLYGAELYVAARLRELRQGAPPWGDVEPAAAISRAEEALGVAYAAGQRAALDRAMRSKVTVVTGGPGVGKTMLLRGLLQVVGERKVAVALCAPTGRAARRLAAATGFEASTVHRLLGVRRGAARRGTDLRLACDLLIVDEASMVDVRLMAVLLRALPDHAALVIVGDADQLPSIGPGQVLADLVRSEAVPVARLEEVFRQKAASRIIMAAHAINRGEVPDLAVRPDSDFYFVDAAHPAEALAKVVALVRDRIPDRFGLHPVRDVQVLCPVNRGSMGAHRLNAELQAALNPPGPRSLDRAGSSFRIGDKVMQVRNDYDRDVSNGELGFVRMADAERGELSVAFEDRIVPYADADIDDLALAYATTIHKAQGSEYPAVVIPIVPQHAPVLRRSLLYTGVTRASRLVVLVGSRATLAGAVAVGEAGRRWSRLGAWLRQ